MTKDAIGQYIVKQDINKIDWADAATSGLIKDPILKNILKAAFDETIKDGWNTNFNNEGNIDLFARLTSTYIYSTLAPEAKETWNTDVGLDVIQKVTKELINDIIIGLEDK